MRDTVADARRGERETDTETRLTFETRSTVGSNASVGAGRVLRNAGRTQRREQQVTRILRSARSATGSNSPKLSSRGKWMEQWCVCTKAHVRCGLLPTGSVITFVWLLT